MLVHLPGIQIIVHEFACHMTKKMAALVADKCAKISCLDLIHLLFNHNTCTCTGTSIHV